MPGKLHKTICTPKIFVHYFEKKILAFYAGLCYNVFISNTGKVRFTLTNDYMFRATFQRNKRALIGLVSALLSINPVLQVSFLDFPLFKDSPEFFATYKFMNTRNHKLYSDKMSLHVVDLTQIENATEEDKLQEIDYWAKLFKATTWEEIKILASNNSFLTEAAETVYQLSAEDRIRLQCEAREDFYNQQRYLQQWRERLEKDCASLEKAKTSLEAKNSSLIQERETLAGESCGKMNIVERT